MVVLSVVLCVICVAVHLIFLLSLCCLFFVCFYPRLFWLFCQHSCVSLYLCCVCFCLTGSVSMTGCVSVTGVWVCVSLCGCLGLCLLSLLMLLRVLVNLYLLSAIDPDNSTHGPISGRGGLLFSCCCFCSRPITALKTVNKPILWRHLVPVYNVSSILLEVTYQTSCFGDPVWVFYLEDLSPFLGLLCQSKM